MKRQKDTTIPLLIEQLSLEPLRQIVSGVILGFLCIAPLIPSRTEAEQPTVTMTEGLKVVKSSAGQHALAVQVGNSTRPVIEITGPLTRNLRSFFLKSPARFVIDLPGTPQEAWNETVVAPIETFFHKVRIATHPEHIRLVFDLRQETNPTVETTSFDESVLLTLETGSSNEIVHDSTVEQDTLPPMPLVPTDEIRAHAALDPDGVLQTTEQDSSSPRVVNQIQFVRLSPSQLGVIRIDLSQQTTFELTRIDSETYRLTLLGVILGDRALGHPLYAPSDFSDFLLVHPEESQQTVNLTIRVPEGTELDARPKDSSIWLKATPSAD
jgi:AMIN domain